MSIQVLGSGCPTCKKLFEQTSFLMRNGARYSEILEKVKRIPANTSKNPKTAFIKMPISKTLSINLLLKILLIIFIA